MKLREISLRMILYIQYVSKVFFFLLKQNLSVHCSENFQRAEILNDICCNYSFRDTYSTRQ